jgi:hypothetical protein
MGAVEDLSKVSLRRWKRRRWPIRLERMSLKISSKTSDKLPDTSPFVLDPSSYFTCL